MIRLPDIFTVLTYCGVWPSTKYYSGWTKKIYDIYTLLVIILGACFVLSGVIQLVVFSHDVDEFVNNGFMQLTMVTAFLKLIVIITKRQNLRKTLEFLKAELCQAKNEEEENILREWNSQNSSFKDRSYIQGYRWYVFCAIVSKLGTMIKYNIPSKTLLFNGWYPFDHAESVGYYIAVLHQVIAHAVCSSIGSSTDVVVCHLIRETCAQLNIFKCRLRRIPEMIAHHIPSLNYKDDNAINGNYNIDDTKEWERKIIQDFMKHHLLIIKFASASNNIFTNVIFLQFFASGLIICISLQLLTIITFMSSDYIYVLLYCSGMILQIFIYCWNGNEVILESYNIDMAVYEMDWMKLSVNMQKYLLVIMKRSVHPIQFASGNIITLSVESFKSLMKTSYSLYNFMNQAS